MENYDISVCLYILVRAAHARHVLAMEKKKKVIRINFKFYLYHKIKI